MTYSRSRIKALLAALVIAVVAAAIPSAKVSEGYVVDNYSIVMGTDGALNWSRVPSEVIPVEFPFVTVSRNQMYGIYYDLIINYVKTASMFDTIVEIEQVPYDLPWLRAQVVDRLVNAPQLGALIFMGHTTNKTYTPFVYQGRTYIQAHRPFPEHWAIPSSLVISSQTEIAPATRSKPVYQLPSLIIAVGCNSAGSFSSPETIMDDVNQTLKDIYSWMGAYRLSLLDTPTYYWYGRGFIGFLTPISPVYNDPWALDFVDSVLYYSISKGYVLGSAVVLASFYTGTGYSVLMKYYRYGRLYPAVYLDRGSSEVALFVGYYDTVVDPLPDRSSELSVYEEAALSKARNYSPLLHELLRTAIENAAKVVINTDSAKGVTRVDWYVSDDYVATVVFADTGTGLEVIGFDVTLPHDVVGELGLSEERLLTELEGIVSRRIGELPPWIGVENITIPGEEYAGEVYLVVDGMKLAILHEDTGFLQANLGILYGVMRTRQGIGVVYYDNTNLISEVLEGWPIIFRPTISVDEARDIAHASLGRLAGGEPGTIVVDGAFAIITPDGAVKPAYIIESIKDHGNHTGTKYLVVVDMTSGDVTERTYEVALLGPATGEVSGEEPVSDGVSPADPGYPEPWLIPLALVSAGVVATALAAVVKRRK